MVRTFFSFLGFSSSSSSSSSSSQISFDVGVPPPPLAPAGDEDASGGAEARDGVDCVVKVEDCSFSSVLKVSVDTGCNAICK